MGLREDLNKRPGLAAGIAIGFCVVSVAIIYWSNADTTRDRVASAYYTADDGKSYFADDIDRVYPFEHDGKPAYRAYVYQCPDAEPVVAYLARYNDATRSKLESLIKQPASPEVANQIDELRQAGIEVRKPGEKDWAPLFSPAGQAVSMHPKCPDGSVARGLMP